MRSIAITAALLFSCACTNLYATHLRAGEIQVKRIDCNSLTFDITLTIYVNTIGSSVTVGGDDDILFFGDGQSLLVPPTNVSQMIDSQLGIGKTIFTIQHTYSKAGSYVISYVEPNRNANVLNMQSSASTRFQIESMILVEDGKCNTYPIFLNPPIDQACQRLAFFHNPVGFDADGDSLSYELVTPKRDNTNPVTDYLNPNDRKFYDLAGIAYARGNEMESAPPVFHIDPFSGFLTWDAPGATGEYATAIKVREWKKNSSGVWYEASYVIRDMQINVNDCSNKRPVLIAADDICVIAGESVDITIRASDPDGDSIRVDFVSELFQSSTYQAVVSPTHSIASYRSSPLELRFTMPTSCATVRSAPYTLIVKVTDRKKNASPLSKYHTVRIHVIAPPPELESVVVNPVSRQVSIQWSTLSCIGLESYQIWRRTSSIEYSEPRCSKGMPAFLRYELIAVVSQAQTTFVDRNLEIGSQYCYRIIAVVSGIPGKLSLDTCLIPKPAEAPVITNVSIEDTDAVDGKILLRWTSPFDIDKTQYPPPYRYQVLRQNETLKLPFEPLGAPQSDTTFIDQSINTSKYTFRYFVQLFVPTLSNSPLDSSSQASSIVATSDSKVDQIELRWSAKTPWSNYAEKNPYHLIFRSTQKDGPFELIDSVNVLSNDFFYADRGRLRPLSRDPYFYKIKTRGTYGNPSVKDPLENFSAVIFGQLLDTIPPCAPVARIEAISCNQFSCDGRSYFTSLRWESTNEPCNEDIVGYEILVKSDTTSNYTSHGIVKETSYRHNNLSNLDYCYRIVAIDHVGNRSDSSVVACNSSCLNFKLPNVITPGNDGQNDFFTAYDEENSTVNDCARSVTRVELLVYNRWGQEIFLKQISNQETRIFWPGTTNTGIEVSAGTYFYKAKVDFQTSDPAKKTQEFKGWVHVIR